jgi:iron complex transport system permease protein
VVVTLLLAAALAFGAYGLTTGDFAVPLPDVLRSLAGNGDAGTDFIVRELRLPRVLTGLLVGAALGLSGAIFQRLTSNPLGSPDFVGITTGAATGALVVILLVGGTAAQISAGAIVGCVLAAGAVYALAFKRGVQGFRLILIGIGVAAMAEAFNSYLIIKARLEEAAAAQLWLIGSLNGAGWEQVRLLLVGLAVLVPLSLLAGRRLPMLTLGDELARAQGVRVESTRAVLIVCSVGLAAVSTAAAGPIGFVALAAPHLSIRLTRTWGAGLVAAGAMGALLVMVSDFLAQRVLGSTELPVGIATSALGGAYLVWFLFREWRGGQL